MGRVTFLAWLPQDVLGNQREDNIIHFDIMYLKAILL